MKKILIGILLIVAIVQAKTIPLNNAGKDCTKEISLESIQSGMELALVNCFKNQNTEELDFLIHQIDSIDFGEDEYLNNYWKAYGNYYKGIYYLKTNQKEKVEGYIKLALSQLTDITEKNSEVYALLAYVRSLTFLFDSGNVLTVFGEIKSDYSRSMELDPNNVRAYYVAGMFDLYTPEQFGGGQVGEEYLLKAIGLPDKNEESPLLPTWGKEDAYVMLIEYYTKKERWEQAIALFEIGILAYPESVRLIQLKQNLSFK